MTDIKTPFTVVSSVLAFFAHLYGYVDMAVHALWATVPTWFPAFSLASRRYLPQVGVVSLPVVGPVDVT